MRRYRYMPDNPFRDLRASCDEGNRAWSGLSGGAPTETGMTGHRPQASGKPPATGALYVWLQAISCGFGMVPAFFRGVGITYVSNGFPKVFDGSGMVPVLAFRNQALGFGNAIPTGFGSGLQGGGNRSQAPRSLPEGLRQARDLHIFPFAVLARSRFRQPVRGGEPVWQIPALERCRLIRSPSPLLQQWQAAHRIKHHISLPAGSPVASDHFCATADHNIMDMAPDLNLMT